MKTRNIVATLWATFGVTGIALGAVSLEITRPPVVGPPNTGPLIDPDAFQGQWFQESGARSHEFYDNVPGNGGGVSSSRAIEGFATNIIYAAGPGTAIVSFSVSATIHNDLGTENGQWADGTNSHNEFLSTPEHYVGAMIDTLMTVEFALADPSLQPATWTLPYTQMLPEIVAVNEDDTAWYCYNNNEPQPLGQGNYYVPAWNFGNIPLGGATNRQLDFFVNGGLLPSDPRYLAIMESEATGGDILSNRTTSLKISNWVDTIGIDPGGPYDPLTNLHSNASVFHIPEAGTSAILALFGILSLRRRR